MDEVTWIGEEVGVGEGVGYRYDGKFNGGSLGNDPAWGILGPARRAGRTSQIIPEWVDKSEILMDIREYQFRE